MANRTSLAQLLGWLLAAGALCMGCGSDPKPPPDTAADTDTSSAAAKKPKKKAQADKEDDGSKGGVSIDERIRSMCNLPEPRFDFDSASVSKQAAGVLDALTACFTDGPGKGKKILLVGHADIRGETMYNIALGSRRAGSVQKYLVRKGLTENRVESSSRGAQDATGTDEEGWARDRRVDILLAE